MRAGLRIACVFVAQGSERLLEALQAAAETRSAADATRTAGRRADHGSAATGCRAGRAAGLDLGACAWAIGKVAPLIVVLAGLQDPGNLGTILRSAEALAPTGWSVCREP